MYADNTQIFASSPDANKLIVKLNSDLAQVRKWLIKNKNALTAAFILACFEIRSRNEEAINSTRNMIYSLKVFYFLLYRQRYFLFVSELIYYAC